MDVPSWKSWTTCCHVLYLVLSFGLSITDVRVVESLISDHFHVIVIMYLSGSCPDSLVCHVLVQCFFVCFVSQHMTLSHFVFAMCSSCPSSLFPLVTPLVMSLSSPHLFDCVHLILVCSAALYCVPFTCVFAGLFWCLPVSWSCVYTCSCASCFDLAQVIFGSLI